MYLPRMELVGNFLFLIRPRRFGKSLFMSMMQYYYDINRKDDFDRLFNGLWIAEHPTELRNSFEVLRLDFSQTGGNLETLEKDFDQYMSVSLDIFAWYYADRYPDGFVETVKSFDDYRGKLKYINGISNKLGHK